MSLATAPAPSLKSRLSPFRGTIRATGGLVAATVATSGTGFVFWWIAARAFPPSAVGLAGAAVSAMLLLSQLAVFGLGTTMAGLLHQERRPASLAMTALLAAGGFGIVFGVLAAVLGPMLSRELGPIGSGPATIAVFAAGVSITAASAVLDQVLVSVMRSSHQLLRNVIFSVSRLVLLVAAAAVLVPLGMVIYGAWAAGTLLSLMVVGLLPAQRRALQRVRPLQWPRLRTLAFGALSHHMLNLSRSSSVWLLPVVVTALISREANASFYVALLLANFIALIGTSATFTLYVVGARAPQNLWRQMQFTMGLSVLASISGTALLALAGPALLRSFGPTYADAAYPTIVLLAAATLPLAVKDHWIAIQRVHGGVGRAAVVGVVLLVVELAAAVVGALTAGIAGLAIGRLVVLALQALVMAPSVVAAMRTPSYGSAPAAQGAPVEVLDP